VIAKLTGVLFHTVNKCDGNAYVLVGNREKKADHAGYSSVDVRITLKCILKEIKRN
jgi:hypothetical protein